MSDRFIPVIFFFFFPSGEGVNKRASTRELLKEHKAHFATSRL